MFTIITKAKWITCRLFYYISVALIILSGGLFIYIAAPLTSYYFFNSFAFWRYLEFFPKLIQQIYRIFFIWLTDANYRKMYTQPLGAPPSTGPDHEKVGLSDKWEYGKDDCAGCCKCCVKIKCPLLGKDNLCLGYNTIYWRYFSCGRFPASQNQIDYYGCKKWEIMS